MVRKIALVVWSKTGNTKMMGDILKEELLLCGAFVDSFKAYNFDSLKALEYDAILLGCPAMGGETLEDSEFLPMYDSIKSNLKDKIVFLFGSYSWGDGKWMRDWALDALKNGIDLFREPIISKEKPDKDVILKLKGVARALVMS